jgi:peptide/nickel transport system permease protein
MTEVASPVGWSLTPRLARVRQNPTLAISTGILIIMVLSALFAPWLAPFDPNEQIRGMVLKPPSWTHLFGTDEFGRDLFSRVLYGARVSLLWGVVAVALGGFVGVVLGVVAGYVGGAVDALIMRTTDVLLAYPAVLVAILIVAVLGPGPERVALALAIVSAPQMVRLVRALVLQQKDLEFVLSARSLGSSNWRIVRVHILPQITGPLLVQLAVSMGYAVLLESALSFLGLGVQPPTASWGVMLNQSRATLFDAPWYAIFPGVAIALLTVSLNLMADGLRQRHGDDR